MTTLRHTPLVPFNRPFRTGRETVYIEEAFANVQLSGDGPFTRRCQEWLREWSGAVAAFLTPSCTDALEMSALLAEVAPGDEVIMPSFTFVTTANAFVLRGATPVFVDVEPETLNIDPECVKRAITPNTRAIVAVHYAGVGCDMDALAELADANGLLLIEDAAQAAMSRRGGRPLGSIGALATLSFHETKNLTCGEGGALLVNDERFVERAEILRDKGTNRQRFARGEVAKYTWVDLGSSYLLGDASAAFLWAQLEAATRITSERLRVWRAYHERLAPLEVAGLARRPVVPDSCEHNAHLYYLLLPDGDDRPRVLDELAARGVNSVFHYVPLHSSPAGRRYGRAAEELRITDALSASLIRLPLWPDMHETEIDLVTRSLFEVLRAG
jgi:dTDP-4-amino-4,6-dideoxygalactose transaminase